MTWAGRVLDPLRLVWIDWIKKNVDPDFVDDDPKIGSEMIEWRWDAEDGLLELNEIADLKSSIILMRMEVVNMVLVMMMRSRPTLCYIEETLRNGRR